MSAGVAPISTSGLAFSGVRFQTDVGRAGGPEGVGEVPRSATDVEDGPAGQVDVLPQLLHGVGGECGVEARRVGLLVPELADCRIERAG